MEAVRQAPDPKLSREALAQCGELVLHAAIRYAQTIRPFDESSTDAAYAAITRARDELAHAARAYGERKIAAGEAHGPHDRIVR